MRVGDDVDDSIVADDVGVIVEVRVEELDGESWDSLMKRWNDMLEREYFRCYFDFICIRALNKLF